MIVTRLGESYASRLGAICLAAQSPLFARKWPLFICYTDESGTSDVPGNSSHFVLAGIAIPIDRWRDTDDAISAILSRYDLDREEIHTGWMLRPYPDQDAITNFALLDRPARRAAAERERASDILKAQRSGNPKRLAQIKKNHKATAAYSHLTLAERQAVVTEVAQCVGSWDYAAIFVEAINKLFHDKTKTQRTIDEQALEQIVTRFQLFLKQKSVKTLPQRGIVVHDNNESVAKKHTEFMKNFYKEGTLWAKITLVVETPFFVDSRLNRMVQIADLVSYAFRRYLENNENDLFDSVFGRVHRLGPVAVGARHYTAQPCPCTICKAHETAYTRYQRNKRRRKGASAKTAS